MGYVTIEFNELSKHEKAIVKKIYERAMKHPAVKAGKKAGIDYSSGVCILMKEVD